MGKDGQESDFKSKLVSEICSISTWIVDCSHKNHCSLLNPPFIDWYRVLGVYEDAGIDIIRKRYHKLALQLHPDKNKHPKAEIAFKLVSEAYTCLSDDIKRRAFNMERWENFCNDCKTIPYRKTKSPRKPDSSERKFWNNSKSSSRSYKILQSLIDIRDRFREEAMVIESCLRAKATTMKETPVFNPKNPEEYLFKNHPQQRVRKESPIFNPSDYRFQGYPHIRAQIYKKEDNFWCLRTPNVMNCERGSSRYDYPIFDIR